MLRDGRRWRRPNSSNASGRQRVPWHAPKSVDFVDALPLTPLGKLDKKALRAQFWEGAARSV
ncbi:hypothetical protein GS421_14935 [Rhodococcus hoagii]|nr:hypothetical protein [Prescottella equi]